MNKGTTGASISRIERFISPEEWDKNGKYYCRNCSHFAFGYYCKKMKKDAPYKEKPKTCRFFMEWGMK